LRRVALSRLADEPTVNKVSVLVKTVVLVLVTVLGRVLLPELGVVGDTGLGTSVDGGHGDKIRWSRESGIKQRGQRAM
jgi:hypothetical protein